MRFWGVFGFSGLLLGGFLGVFGVFWGSTLRNWGFWVYCSFWGLGFGVFLVVCLIWVWFLVEWFGLWGDVGFGFLISL